MTTGKKKKVHLTNLMIQNLNNYWKLFYVLVVIDALHGISYLFSRLVFGAMTLKKNHPSSAYGFPLFATKLAASQQQVPVVNYTYKSRSIHSFKICHTDCQQAATKTLSKKEWVCGQYQEAIKY